MRAGVVVLALVLLAGAYLFPIQRDRIVPLFVPVPDANAYRLPKSEWDCVDKRWERTAEPPYLSHSCFAYRRREV